ncbi:macrophage migration inhibitory factor-like [Bufo gargarizans]|uniref:macrophage migration inhibitory factor-like n=1 Tax=Bufo gargarizans TaxID=30331 RepID=UPI001CF3D550|nr:macrophage migration inhibitory factor-like [Bufo gargarizans]
MPVFTLYTNICHSAMPQTIMTDLWKLFEQTLDVPAKYIAVIIHPDQKVIFGGTKDPCGLCSLQRIGMADGLRNEHYSRIICEFLQKHLQIPPDRVYINFIDIIGANVGWNSTTLAGFENKSGNTKV